MFSNHLWIWILLLNSVSGLWCSRRNWQPWMKLCLVTHLTLERYIIQIFLWCILLSKFDYLPHGNLVASCLFGVSSIQVGRERQRFDFDDFDTVPSKFNIWERRKLKNMALLMTCEFRIGEKSFISLWERSRGWKSL